MSTITYFPYEQELIEFCKTVDVSDYEPPKNWGGWNEKIHGNIVWKHTEETKKLISKNRKGFRHTTATKKKMSESHTGSKQSPETVEKRRLKLIGRKRTPETKKKMSEAKKGKKLSEESLRLRRKKMSKWLIVK